jgi:antitoxin component YwqK of YwqJK toxin-antitoxin module
MLRGIVCAWACILFVACSSGDGWKYERIPQKIPRGEWRGLMKNGKREGVWCLYERGDKAARHVVCYLNGKRHGASITFARGPSNLPTYLYVFRDGRYTGVGLSFLPDGTVNREGLFWLDES